MEHLSGVVGEIVALRSTGWKYESGLLDKGWCASRIAPIINPSAKQKLDGERRHGR